MAKTSNIQITDLSIEYLLVAAKNTDVDAVGELLNDDSISDETGEAIMTIAEHLKSQGYASGLVEGKVSGRKEQAYATARNMLNASFDPELIASMTELSFAEVMELNAAAQRPCSLTAAENC